MIVVVLDFETYFDSKFYTLSKMTTEAYVRDPRFAAHLCGLRWSDGSGFWVPREDLPQAFASIDWSQTAVLCHHAHFDGLILSHHYNVRPAFIFDTLSMARHSLGNAVPKGLGPLASRFNLRGKTIDYVSFDGRSWDELAPRARKQLGDGCVRDCEITWRLFKLLLDGDPAYRLPFFPREELEAIDSTVRMFTEPVLRCDVGLLADCWEAEERRRLVMYERVRATGKDLRSDAAFASLLLARGVEPETKTTDKGNVKYAFARTDPFMKDLAEDEDPEVRALVEARLGAKSSILQTRAATFADMAGRGAMPVYLNYCGASTLRFSGGDGTNFQNLKRSDVDNNKQASPLRRAILAPEGYLLAPIDLSQIECRVLSYLAGQEDAIEEFRRGDDPYISLASAAYGYTVTKEMKLERGTGKQLKLSCGYMAGGKTIQRTARLGIYGPPVVIDLPTAERWKNIYRNANPAVVQYWRTAGRMLARIAGGPPLEWGPFVIRDQRLWLPNETCMIYDGLEFYVPTIEECELMSEEQCDRDAAGYWRVPRRNGWKKLHSGVLTQNICEYVARVIVTQAMVRLRRLGYRALNVPHDELLMLIPRDGNEERHLEMCIGEMRREPSWLPGIPLDCEGALGDRYEK